MHLKGKKFIIGTSPLFNFFQSHTAACLHKIVLARLIRFYRFFFTQVSSLNISHSSQKCPRLFDLLKFIESLLSRTIYQCEYSLFYAVGESCLLLLAS